MNEQRNAAVVLGAGRGTRMKSALPKQYLDLSGQPVIAWPLQAFEQFDEITDVVLVTDAQEVDYCRREIVERFGLKKVAAVIPGGKRRCDSVECALRWLEDAFGSQVQWVMIHDGARPLIDAPLLKRNLETAKQRGNAVSAMPVKDTIKEAGEKGEVVRTIPREDLWQIQTPQTFLLKELLHGYDGLCPSMRDTITDDAMIVEQILKQRVWLCEGSYRNLKVTTPEDLVMAKALMEMNG